MTHPICPHCGFESCENRTSCEREARFDIEQAINWRFKYDVTVNLLHERDLEQCRLSAIAGDLMRKWFPDE